MSKARLERAALPVGVLLTAGIIGCAASALASSLAEIKQRGYMVVAVSVDGPAGDMAEDGKPAGFDAQLLNKLRKSAPFELRETIVPAGELAEALRSGKADLVATRLEITPEQQERVAFSMPLAESTLYYLTRKDDGHIRSIADLSGKPFGVRAGGASFLALTELEHRMAKAGGKLGEPVEFETDQDVCRALRSGEIDYMIDDIVDLEAATRQQPKAFAIGKPVAHATYEAWAVAKDNHDLVDFVQAFLSRERSNGELAELQRRFLGRSFDDLPEGVTARDWWAAREDKPAILPIPTLRDPD